SVRWALDPAYVPAGNGGFLRDDAYLAVVLVTNEDDCSVPDDSELFDPRQTLMSDPLGPLWSFRCNEFGHICNNNGVIGPPPRGAVDGLTDCVSNDHGMLTSVADEIAFLRSLKSNPNQVFVSAITGPATPYGIELVDRTTPFGVTEPQANMKHSCMQSSGEYADPAVRLRQWTMGFGANGLVVPICADDFKPALSQFGGALAHGVGPNCVTGTDAIDPATGTFACRVVDRYTLPDNRRIDTVIHPCTISPFPDDTCWTIQP